MAAAVALVGGACGGDAVPPEFLPDSLLRAELGLTDADEVHRVTVTGGPVESLEPAQVEISPGAWVEFATTDWRVHVVRFDAQGLSPEGRAFLEDTDQMGSPPLVERDARFVVSFRDAPTGRYPFLAEGNGAAARGVVVVVPRR